jgi:phosphate transport system permease protein
MTNNLAGIPSIVFGLFGMSLFVNTLGFGDSIIAARSPWTADTSSGHPYHEEALNAVPQTFRQASYALGATKVQTIRR